MNSFEYENTDILFVFVIANVNENINDVNTDDNPSTGLVLLMAVAGLSMGMALGAIGINIGNGGKTPEIDPTKVPNLDNNFKMYFADNDSQMSITEIRPVFTADGGDTRLDVELPLACPDGTWETFPYKYMTIEDAGTGDKAADVPGAMLQHMKELRILLPDEYPEEIYDSFGNRISDLDANKRLMLYLGRKHYAEEKYQRDLASAKLNNEPLNEVVKDTSRYGLSYEDMWGKRRIWEQYKQDLQAGTQHKIGLIAEEEKSKAAAEAAAKAAAMYAEIAKIFSSVSIGFSAITITYLILLAFGIDYFDDDNDHDNDNFHNK